jgi:hypothetical protein
VLKKAALELRSCPTAILAKSGCVARAPAAICLPVLVISFPVLIIYNWAIYNKILYYQEITYENAILAMLRSRGIKHVIYPITKLFSISTSTGTGL